MKRARRVESRCRVGVFKSRKEETHSLLETEEAISQVCSEVGMYLYSSRTRNRRVCLGSDQRRHCRGTFNIGGGQAD